MKVISSNDVFSITVSPRETLDYRERGVSQEKQGALEEMWVVYNNIIKLLIVGACVSS